MPAEPICHVTPACFLREGALYLRSVNRALKVLLGFLALVTLMTSIAMPFLEAAGAEECLLHQCEQDASDSHESCPGVCHHECAPALLPVIGGFGAPEIAVRMLEVRDFSSPDGVRDPIDHPPQLS